MRLAVGPPFLFATELHSRRVRDNVGQPARLDLDRVGRSAATPPISQKNNGSPEDISLFFFL